MEQCSKKEIDNEEMKKSVVGCLMCLRCLTFLKLSVFATSTWQDLESGKMLTEIERHTKDPFGAAALPPRSCLKRVLSYGLIYGV